MELLETKCLHPDVIELTFEDKLDANENWQIGKFVELFEENGNYYVKQESEDLFSEVTFKNPGLSLAVSSTIVDAVISVTCYKNKTAVAIRYVHLLNSYSEKHCL